MIIKKLKTKSSISDKIIEYICYNEFSCWLRHVGRFIRRLPTFLRLCWKQENWDYEYLYDLIEYKLKEFLIAQQQDTWHVESETKRRAKEIKICLARLDRFRNWPNYYDYPMDDITWQPLENGNHKLVFNNPENEKQRLGAYDFEKKNYDKFWNNFLKWHRGWWT